MDFLLLLIPAALYSLSWVLMKKYQRMVGAGKFATAFYNMVGGCFSFSLLLCIKGFSLYWNIYTLIFAIIYGVGLVLYNGFKVKAAENGPLALVSMATTLGAVILSMLYGFIFLQEKVTVMKIVCVVFVVLSFVPLIAKVKGQALSGKFILACVLCFLGNGILTDVSKVAQTFTPDSSKSIDFVALYFFFCFLSSSAFMLPSITKSTEIERKNAFSIPAIIVAMIAVGANTFGSLTTFLFAFRFDASVQYPAINVGIMIMTTLMAMFMYSEKPSKSTILSLIFAAAAVICVSLPF